MNRDYLNQLKEYTDSILKTGNETKPYWMLAKYNCSEVSRLVGIKVLHELGKISKPFILKGKVTKNNIDEDNFHDILGFFNNKLNKFILVDPTIWQFFPKKRNILLGEFQTLNEAISFAEKFYVGEWKLSEYIDKEADDVNKMKEIIKVNCDQAPNWKN